jgi:hypothetical protein
VGYYRCLINLATIGGSPAFVISPGPHLEAVCLLSAICAVALICPYD